MGRGRLHWSLQNAWVFPRRAGHCLGPPGGLCCDVGPPLGPGQPPRPVLNLFATLHGPLPAFPSEALSTPPPPTPCCPGPSPHSCLCPAQLSLLRRLGPSPALPEPQGLPWHDQNILLSLAHLPTTSPPLLSPPPLMACSLAAAPPGHPFLLKWPLRSHQHSVSALRFHSPHCGWCRPLWRPTPHPAQETNPSGARPRGTQVPRNVAVQAARSLLCTSPSACEWNKVIHSLANAPV